MSAKSTPMGNPFFINETDLAFSDRRTKFHSRIFVLSKHGGDNEEYEELMNSLHPFDQESNMIVNPYSKIIRSIDSEGNIVVHVEYLELLEDEPDYLAMARSMAESEGRAGDEEFIKYLERSLRSSANSINW